MSRALQVYTTGPEYYRSVIAGLPRVDLDGVVRAAITSDEIRQAERLLLEFESRARSRKIPASEGHAVLAELVTSFPACFKPRDVRGRPAVAIGIHGDILERRPDLDLARVRKALWAYVTGLDYLRGMIPGAPRVDLDGSVTQFVTEQEATNAKRRLAFLRDRIKAARVAAEGKAERENVGSLPTAPAKPKPVPVGLADRPKSAPAPASVSGADHLVPCQFERASRDPVRRRISREGPNRREHRDRSAVVGNDGITHAPVPGRLA